MSGFFDIPEPAPRKSRATHAETPVAPAPSQEQEHPAQAVHGGDESSEDQPDGEPPEAEQPAEQVTEPEIRLAHVVQALRPIFKPIDDPDPRSYTRGAYYWPVRDGSRGYLVTTNTTLLLAVRLPDDLCRLMGDPGAVQHVALLSDTEAGRGHAYVPSGRSVHTTMFGRYGWLEQRCTFDFPDWTKIVPTTRLDREWTAKLDSDAAATLESVSRDVMKALGKDPVKFMVPKMLGDATNNTTPRVFACPDFLAVFAPLIVDENHSIDKSAVLDFLDGAKE